MTISSDFTKLDAERSGHLERCRECAQLTIPSLLPPSGYDENTDVKRPWQSLGARGVNNLASKLLLTLFPPNEPIVKLVLDEMSEQELVEQIGEEGLETQVNTELRRVEEATVEYMEAKKFRVPMFRALRKLVATGNVLLEKKDNGTLRSHKLDKYVVQRDNDGEPYRIILMEYMSKRKAEQYVDDPQTDEKDRVALYTGCEYSYNDKKWTVKQELADVEIGEPMTYKRENFPFIPVVWHREDEDNYGSGHVEDYIGDLTSYNGLSKAIQDGSSIASKLVFLLKPNGVTRLADLKNVENGGVTYGDPDEVGMLGIEKDRDFTIALKKAESLESELSKCFLMHFSVQRPGERVTATEIQYLAQELEDTLGGIYSALLSDMQMPILNLVMTEMGVNLPEDVKPILVTGFEALGRNHELKKLNNALGSLGQFVPNGEHMRYFRIPELIDRVMNASRVDMSGLVKSEEEVRKEIQQEQQAQAMANMAPQIAEAAKEKLKEGQNAPEG